MLPTMFVGHGGGPLPLIGHPSHAGLVQTWDPGSLAHTTLHDPAVKAVLVVSAHHENPTGVVEVMTDPTPPLLFDYGGFPPETYTYTLPNPGAPDLAQRVLGLLRDTEIPALAQSGRGHDHGVFVPLLGLQIEKRPTLPVLSVSLRGPGVHRERLTEDHIELGRALAPLRREGVLIVGSGNSIHGRCTAAQAAAYDAHLKRLIAEGPEALTRWDAHPTASVCHKRPEHLVPLLVCAGAAPTATIEAVEYTAMNDPSLHLLFR